MRLVFLLAASSIVLASGCPAPPPPEEPPHLLYSSDAQSLDNPFPDGRLLTPEGMRLRADWFRPFLMARAVSAKMNAFLAQWTEGARDLQGFGNFGPTLLRSSEPLDPASLPGHAARLKKVGGGYEVLEADVALEHSQDALAGTDEQVPPDYPEFLVARPSVPLPDGGQGLLVLTRGLKTRDGRELGRGFDFADEPGSAGLISAAAGTLGISEDEVLLALPVKGSEVLPALQGLAAWTRTAPAPEVTFPAKGTRSEVYGGDRYVGIWNSADPDWGTFTGVLTRWSWENPASDVGEIAFGTVKARDLRENGIWRADWVGDPSSAPQVDLAFVLTLPKGPKPAGGYKVVIGGHGLNGRNTLAVGSKTSFCLEVAQLLASRGLGCLGIDAPEHGTRGNSFDFFAVEDLRRVRDNFREMAFDQMQLAQAAAVIDVDGDQQPDLSPELGYFGNSLGGIMGGTFVSLDARVKYGALNVPGGGLGNILTGPSIRDEVGLLLVAKSGLTFGSVEYYSTFPLFRTVGQLFMEQGDPVNVAAEFRSTNRAVLVQEGVGDRTVPNMTTEDLARAMGVELASQPEGGSAVRKLTHIDPQKYGKPAGYNGHNVFWDIAAARTQVMDFLASGGTQLTVE